MITPHIYTTVYKHSFQKRGSDSLWAVEPAQRALVRVGHVCRDLAWSGAEGWVLFDLIWPAFFNFFNKETFHFAKKRKSCRLVSI